MTGKREVADDQQGDQQIPANSERTTHLVMIAHFLAQGRREEVMVLEETR